MPDKCEGLSFVNCTRSALLAGVVTLLPPLGVVLEILEDIEPDLELLECCRELRKKGYRFALDDFSPHESKLPFLEIADFIKVDFLASAPPTRATIYELAAKAGATVLAEKVETRADFQIAKSEGCLLFQGYFFSKPVVVETSAIPQNHTTYFKLLSILTQTPTNLSEVEALVMQEASLSYRLLRLVNSTLYVPRSPITSIRDALMIVGEDEFKKMVTVALAGDFNSRSAAALIQMALERARFCEMIAPLINEAAPRLYLLGLISLLDTILSMPMSRVLAVLPIDDEMKAALMGIKIPLARALMLIRSYESGDWQQCAEIRDALGITEYVASMIYFESMQWANKVLNPAVIEPTPQQSFFVREIQTGVVDASCTDHGT